MRSLIDGFATIPNTTALQVDVCKSTIQWAVKEKTVFLRQALETKLVSLWVLGVVAWRERRNSWITVGSHSYLDNRMYSDALALIATLLRELKRLDDKNALMEVQLLESRVYHALRNLPKSRVG